MPLALACGAVLCWLAASMASAAATSIARVNVTFSGLPPGAQILLPENWTATLLSDVLSVRSVRCPAGRYCPGNTSFPLACPEGTFSNETGRQSECADLCPQNFFCTDPGWAQPCPQYTVSNPGGVSKLDCQCVSGYSCVYRKQISVKILVPVSLKTWLHNASLQQALIAAITASAGVLPSSVVIDHALLHPQASATRKRRLLMRMQPPGATEYTLLSASITRGRPPRDLSSRLALLPSPLRHARARWALIDHIHVAAVAPAALK